MHTKTRKPLVIGTLMLAGFSFAGATENPNSSDAISQTTRDTVDVQHVMDAYHDAVISRDGARLYALFIADGGTWLNVLSEDAYARAKAQSPTAVKIRVGSYKDFAKLVATTKSHFNPTHTNLHVSNDGTIATATFDFVFMSDGKEVNRGSESWQLVNTAGGWRIAAITYSSNPAAP